VTASEALQDRHFVAGLAAKARIDARTVKNALHGKPGRGLAHEVAMRAIREAGITTESVPPKLTSVGGGAG
jgi:hypothetical protein